MAAEPGTIEWVDHILQFGHELQLSRQDPEYFSLIEQFGSSLFPGINGELLLRKNNSLSFQKITAWGEKSNLQIIELKEECELLQSEQPQNGSCRYCEKSGVNDKVDTEFHLCVPVYILGKVSGILRFFCPDSEKIEGQPNMIKGARLFSQFIGQTLSKIQTRQNLSRYVLIDPATGLFSARFFHEILEREISRATRGKYSLALAHLCIEINSSHDEKPDDLLNHILPTFSKKLKKKFRLSDSICKIHADTLAIVLPGMPKDSFVPRITQILKESLASPIVVNEKAVDLLINVGGALFPQNADAVSDLISGSEAALQLARQDSYQQIYIFD